MSALSISVAELADVPALCDLLAVLFAQEAEFTPDHAVQRAGLTLIVQHPDAGRIFVARDATGVVGMVSLLDTLSTALGGRVGLLEDLVVAPGRRGRGIGSSLLEHALAFARDNGLLRVTLLTDADNEAAHRFYARHGFRTSRMIPLRCLLTND